MTASLVEALARHADGSRGIHFVERGEGEVFLPYGELYSRARRLLGLLHAMGIQAGDCALLVARSDESLVTLFWACLMGRIVPAPLLYPGNDDQGRRIVNVFEAAGRPWIVTDGDLGRLGEPALRERIVPCPMPRGGEPEAPVLEARPGDLCHVQFSSGSTGRPKGVQVTHGNVLHNVAGILGRHGFGPGSRFLSWLPLTHDFGLVFFHLMPVVLGADHWVMPTQLFVRQPLAWMERAARHRVQVTGAPCSAYERVCQAYSPEAARAWDLSALEFVGNGAEPISLRTVRAFLDLMAPHGLRRQAMTLGYGLAEGTLIVSMTEPGAELREISGAPDVGRPVEHVEARIAGPDGAVLPEGTSGRVQIRGASVTPGYFNDPEATAAALSSDGWLDTGDLGFLDGGRLVVTGRAKELIILDGVNYHPHDVEAVASAVEGVGSGKMAACGIRLPGREKEELVLFVQFRGGAEAFLPLDRRLRDEVIRRMGIQVGLCVPVRRIPRTPSGKVQRLELARRLRDGELDAVLAELAERATAHAAEVRGALAGSGRSRRRRLRELLLAEARAITGEERIAPGRPLTEQGFTSLRLVEWLRRLNETLGTDHPLSLVFDHPTIDGLADHLLASPPEELEERKERGPAAARGDEPVAIVGMACRFPGGASTPGRFWDLLAAGRDAVTEVPPDRWPADAFFDPDPDAAGKMVTRHGAFLDEVDRFDHRFFAITPVEAASLDPQQRLLLEVSWEALEDAGLDAEALHGSRTGVFLGISNADYAQAEARSGRPADIGPYSITGSALSVAAGRLSYLHGWHGPALTVDTACSSSLVAVHLAVRSLRGGESDLALAGGVNLILSPDLHVGLSRLKALSPDGRCKAFDDDADGYGRGEGCGLVALKRLADAERDGDRVLAVIRGSAVNHDGASNGLTVPSAAAQQAVVVDALRDAALEPWEVDYVEAHGTGTPLGDPLEVQALARVHAGRATPLLLGSVKTNVGHMEAAAGVAGLIKVVLSLGAGLLPPSLHFRQPNRHVDWETLPVALVDRLTPWTADGHPRRAGISSFGLSGTNAHVVVEEHAPPTLPEEPETAGPLLLPLSARSEPALRQMARQYAELLAAAPARSVCAAAAHRRTALPHRLAAVGMDAGELARALEQPEIRRAEAVPSVVFLYTGQGSLYPGAGLGLYATEPVFRAALDRCDEVLRPWLGAPLSALLQDGAALERADIAQPVIVALGHALTELWRHRGVEPCAVAGHSIGEYAATVCAGILDPEDALRLAATRGRLMQELPAGGSMLAIQAGPERVLPLLDGEVSVAAFNGPGNVTVSGSAAAIRRLEEACRREGLRCTELAVTHAFHSPLVEPILESFHAAAAEVRYGEPRLPFVSTVAGGPAVPDAVYWTRQIREPVRFHEAVLALAEERVFLEIGATAALCGLGAQILPDRCWLPSLRRDRPAQTAESLAALFREGVTLDWSAIYPDRGWAVELPPYPWQREESRKAPSRPAAPDTAPPPVTAAATEGKDEVLSLLKRVVYKAAGIRPEELDEHQSLVSMGLDSLLLVRLRQAIQRELGIDVELKRFFEDLDTLDRIAAHLASLRQPAPTAAASSLAPSSSSATPAAGGVEALMAQQVEAMRELFARQLDVLQGLAAAPQPAVKAAAQPRGDATEVKGLYKRLDTGQAAERPPAQRAHLARLTAGYNARTRGSKEHTARHRGHFANSRSVIGFRREWKEMIYPLTVARAEGAKVWDVDGNEYVDVTMGFGALLFGHAPDFVRQALKDEIDRGAVLGPQGTLAGEVAERIHEMTGCERVAFFTTGTEAVMVGVRVARAVTGRDKLAIFSNSYHGSFDSLLATGWVDDEGATTVPIAAGTPQSLVDDVLVLPYGDPRSLDILRARAGEIAAVLVEPVQSREPTMQPREFLRELREITREAGAALLFDEMIVGFRCQPGGAQAWFGVEADLVTYGKVLGGGMPIGVLAGKRRFLDAVDGGPWTYGDDSVPESYTAFVAGTYNGHPLTMAAARAVLDRLREEGPGLQERLNRRTERFLAELNGFFAEEEVPIRVVGFSSLFRFVMSGDCELLNYHLLDNGVFVWEGRNCFLSAAHTDEDVARIVAAVKQSVAAMRQGGWLPPRSTAPEPIRLPLARAQQEMWFLVQSEPEAAPAYHEMLALDLTGRIDADALRTALRRLVDRHAALRTVAIREDGQTLAPSLEIPLPESPVEDGDLRQALEWALDEPFDLSAGPLLRARLLRRPGGRAALVLVVHHLIADGWSLGLMAQELLALYEEASSGRPAALPPASHPADFLAWEGARAAAGATGTPLLEEPFPALKLPADHAVPARRGYRGARLHLREQALYDEVRRFSRERGVSPVMTFFAAWSLLLARLSSQTRFVVGVPYAGQLEMGAESLVGQCSVLLPVPVEVDFGQPFGGFLEATRQRLLGSYEKTGRLFSALDLEEVSRIPRINVLFNMDRPVSLELPGIAVDLLPVPVRSAKLDLFLNVMELDGRVMFDVDFNTGLFEEATVAGWVERLFALLRKATTAAADATLAELVEEIPQPVPRAAGERRMTGRVEPRNELEEALCRIWGTALGTDRVGVTDDFLELGGHSLKAVHILARIEAELGLRFTIRDLFERPTVAELAALAASRRRSWEPIPALPPASRYPVSHAQLRLWMLDQMEPGLVAYNIPFAIVFEGEVDRQALRRALSSLAARHETLRTRFVAEDGVPFQIVDGAEAVLGEATPVTSVDAERLTRELAARPFNLAAGPLWRVDLLQRPGGTWLVCNLHHIISDVWSLGLFASELLALYQAEREGRDAGLAPLPIQYRDFAAWQRQRTAPEDLGYWAGKLGGGLTPVTYPADFARPVARTYNGASYRFEIAAAGSASLGSFCRSRGVSLFMALAAACKAQLHSLTGQEDVVIGSVIAGRDHPDVAGLIGFFVNSLALRNTVRATDTFDDLLGRVRATVLEAFEHAGVPWDEVVDQLRMPRDPSRNPVFDVVLVMDDREDADALARAFGVSFVELETPTAQFDFTLYVTTGPDRIRFNAVFNTDLYRPRTVERFMDELRRLIEAAVANPDRTLSELGTAAGPRVPSYLQERLWFVDRFEAGSLYPAQPVYYNMPLVARLAAPLDPVRLDAAVERVAARHEALRMRLVTEGDRPAVRIAEGRSPVEVVELAPDTDLAARIERPFDLERDVLWRVELILQTGREPLLLLVAHHAIADHVALRQILAELAAFYQGEPPGEPGIPFGDLARRQKAGREAAIARDLPYWREQLAGLTALELPTDRKRPAIHLYRAATAEVGLPSGIPSGEAALLAVFHALLHRYSGQDDIATGVVDRPEGLRCVGPLADYLVLRSSFAGDPSMRSLASRLGVLLAGARAHRSLAFDELVLQLRPRNDMSRTALFDVLFRFETADETAPPFELLETNRGWGKFDLNLFLREERGGLRGVMTYNAELFDRATIERLLGHLRRLAEAAAAEPETPVRDLPLLTPEEEACLAAGQFPSPFPRRTVHGLFEERAAADPGAIALTLGADRLSYGDLDSRSNCLARRLRGLGVGPGALVGVYLGRSFELVTAILAILKAGGAYVPLDPEYPERRLTFMIEDAGLRWVVTDRVLAGTLPEGNARRVLLDEAVDLDPSAFAPAAGPEDPCYVIYTSGSSGRPKGVVVEHRNVVSLLFHEGSPFDFGPADVWTLFHSPCFDFSVWEMYGALLFGGRLVIVPREAARDSAAFRELLAAERVTVLNQTPAAFYALMQADEAHLPDGLALRWIVFGGEKLLPSKLVPWRERYPDCRLVNMYGITETTVHVTFKELADGDLAGGQSVIGRPLASVSAWIVDARGRLQPTGVPGEVLVGGHGVARGYLNRKELTAERFVPHPFGGEGRVYRSGDLARLRADGELVYLGRIDQQVKVRGFRIEPGEIEVQLLAHDAIREAVVTLRQEEGGDARLEAWLVVDGDPTLEEVLGFLGERLPEHMVPGRFFRIASVPMTGNGKVDHAALARLDAEELGTATGFVAPRTDAQRVLAEIWGEVLQRDRVGMTDNFFELGGHSLKANQAVARIRRRLERDVSLKDFFSAPHLAALAEIVASRPRLACGAIEPVPPAEHHPVSFAQRRLWAVHQVEPWSVAYNMVGVYRLTGALDTASLQAAFRALVDRHESLRTTFRPIAGEPRQVIATRREVLTLIADGSPTEIVRRELEHVFDLEAGPLVRATLLSLPEEPETCAPQHLLVVNLHHIVSDGWSVAVLIRELMAFYAGDTLPPLRIQYKDYAAWQLAQWSGGGPSRQRDFWLGQFQDGAPALDLPAGRERPARRSGRGALVTRGLSEELSARLRGLALEQRTTLFALLTSALQVLLFRLTGQRDLVVGTPVAGRGHVDLESQVGFYLNLLGLRGRISTADTVRRLLDQATDTIAAAFENQDYPYDLLVGDLGLGRDESRNPLFDVLLILQNNEPVRLELDGVLVEELPDQSVSSKYDLNFMVEDRPALELKIEYSTDLFDHGTVTAMAEDFLRLAEAMAADPDRKVHELAGSPPEEQQAFLAATLDMGCLDPEGW